MSSVFMFFKDLNVICFSKTSMSMSSAFMPYRTPMSSILCFIGLQVPLSSVIGLQCPFIFSVSFFCFL